MQRSAFWKTVRKGGHVGQRGGAGGAGRVGLRRARASTAAFISTSWQTGRLEGVEMSAAVPIPELQKG